MEQKEGARQRIDSHDDDVFGGEIPKFDANDLKQVMLTVSEKKKRASIDSNISFFEFVRGSMS